MIVFMSESVVQGTARYTTVNYIFGTVFRTILVDRAKNVSI